MNKINELRERVQPDFKTGEDLYAYAADNNSVKITSKQAYKAVVDNLLPVFKVAKELCEYLDENYFKENKHNKQLYHMALVSRMVKNINNFDATDEEKKQSLHLSNPHYMGIIYIKNGKKITKQAPFMNKADMGFKNLISKSLEGCSAYDDQLTTIYFGAIKEDVSPIFNEVATVSVSGNFLNWQAAKNSNVLFVASRPFINKEMNKMAKEKGFDYSRRFEMYQDAEKKIQDKIAEFCDMKATQQQQQIQKGLQQNSPIY